MNIQQLIEWLSTIPDTHKLRGLENPHPYRGYLDRLAFEPTHKLMSPSELIELAENAFGLSYKHWNRDDVYIAYNARHTDVYISKPDEIGELLTKPYFYPYDIALVFQYFEESVEAKQKYNAWLRFRGVK